MLDVLFVHGAPGADVLCWPYVGISPDNFLQPAWTPLTGVCEQYPLIELMAGGTGAMLIRRRVLEKVAEPWFEFKFDRRGVLVQGEDYNFCEKVRAAGFRIFGLNCPETEVGHIKTVNLANVASALSRVREERPPANQHPGFTGKFSRARQELRWREARTLAESLKR